MRSSRSGPDPLHPGPAGFAHRGLHGAGVPENSLAAFAAAIRRGAGIECDVRLTADGVPLVFHDRDARRLCGSPAILRASTAAALADLCLADGSAIPSIAALLDLTGGRVPLLIELKDDANAARLAAAVAAVLVGQDGPVGVMSFAAGVGHWLKRHAPHIRRGLVLSGRESTIARWHKMHRAKPQFLAVKTTELAAPWVQRARRRMPVYSWTVRSPADRGDAAPLADSLIWEADGRP